MKGRAYSFRIDKGVPIPPPTPARPHGPHLRWPFRLMEPGDSFRLPYRVRRDAEHAAFTAAARAGVKVTFRRIKGGIRVWRSV